MASKKITELTAAGALTGAELVELVQGGVNVKSTAQDIADLGGGGGSGTVESVTGDGVDNTDPDNPVLTFPVASEVVNTPAGSISSTNIQDAINELDASQGPKFFVISVTDDVIPITTGTAKITFRMPFAMTLGSVRASLTVAQTSGSILTIDINENGSSILSTKLTIDNTETTSVTAATPAVISDSALADNAEIKIDVDQIGDGTATGLKIYLLS